jgi:hypothetical protein
MHAGCRTSESFQTGWVYSHLKEVERSLGKPLLLEEFGKKVGRLVSLCSQSIRLICTAVPEIDQL